jgi:HEAT repeat protein
MKTAFLIIAPVAIFVFSGSSFAAIHGTVDDREDLRPDSASDLNSISSELAEKEQLKILLQKLNDQDPFVRVEAVQGLGEIYQEKSLALVCGCLTDDNLYVRAYAAEALGKIGRIDISHTISKLLPALDDPSPYVRSMMILALGELQDKRAIDSIRSFLHDKDQSVRGMAAWALRNIENSQ